MSRAPNLIVLMADQHRADVLGCAGHPVVRTPHIDRLAAQGTRFTRVNCQGPLCMPARASLLTERYVRDHGVFENGSRVEAGTPTVLHALREAGYHNAVIGKTHLWVHGAEGRSTYEMAPVLLEYGFDEIHETVGKLAGAGIRTPYGDDLEKVGLLDVYREHVGSRNYLGRAGKERLPMWDTTPMPLPPEHYVDSWHGQRAANWIDAYAGRAPFHLFVGFPGPHDPWDAPREAVELYRNAEIPDPATLERPAVPESGAFRGFTKVFLSLSSSKTATPERIREVRRAYYANVTLIDEAVGRIIAALERRGWLDDTWIVYTSDHGEMNGEHGLFAKMFFYDAALRVPLIVRPPGGAAPQQIDALLEHMDLSATLREIAAAPPIPASDARSLLGCIQRAAPAPARDVSVSENFGFACFETDRYKLVCEETGLAPAQLFDRRQDPTEDRNLVGSPDHSRVVDELMATHVRPFFRTPPLRPHAPTIRPS